jgi:hypothetical protein
MDLIHLPTTRELRLKCTDAMISSPFVGHADPERETDACLRLAAPGSRSIDMKIGRALGVKRTNMVPIANGLMKRELIERTAADGRSHSN